MSIGSRKSFNFQTAAHGLSSRHYSPVAVIHPRARARAPFVCDVGPSACARPRRINIFIYRLTLFLQSFLCNDFHTRHCLCNFPFSVSLFSPLFPSLSERAMNGWKIITITHIIEPSLWQVRLEEPFFHQPKWFHYRGFHIP